MFSRPGEELYLRQVARFAGAGLGAAQRELKRLTEAGILERRVQGRQVFYRANPDSPYFAELKGLILKTAGLRDVLTAALAPFGKRIRLAFIFGSFARGAGEAASDVDLLVVGAVSLKGLVPALSAAQARLGREINPVVLPEAEFRQRLAAGDRFLGRVLADPKIFVIGDEDEFGRLAEKRVAAGPPKQSARNRRPAGRG